MLDLARDRAGMAADTAGLIEHERILAHTIDSDGAQDKEPFRSSAYL
jgi:hypothetical protein